MKSIFEQTSTRIFCIAGSMDDIYCIKNGRVITSFEELLSCHLHNIGYEAVLFYSGAGKNAIRQEEGKEVKEKYNLYAITQNSIKILNNIHIKPGKKDRREADSVFLPGVAIKQDAISVIDSCMRDTKEKKAIVISSLSDFVNETLNEEGKNSKASREFNRCMEEWKSFDNNENIIIFLAKNMGISSVNEILHNSSYRALYSTFIHENAGRVAFNNKACLFVGCPKNDEIRMLLEHLRLVGTKLKKGKGGTVKLDFSFKNDNLENLTRKVVYYSRKEGATLKETKERLCRYMREHNKGGYAYITPDDLGKYVYPNCEKDIAETQKPLDFIREREGWDGVADVIQSAINRYKREAANGTVEAEEDVEFKAYCIDRLEVGTETGGAKIPNFVLQGPPGVGKTAIAGLIGKILQEEGILKSGHTVEAKRESMIADHVGGSAIKTANLIANAQEGVLLVDEVYSLASDKSSAGFTKEAMDTLVAAMTESNNRMCVIFSGYESKMDEVWAMNEGLYSRFPISNIISLHGYDDKLLMKIFINAVKSFMIKNGVGKKETYFDELLEADDQLLVKRYFKNLYDSRDRERFGNARDMNNLAVFVGNNAIERTLATGTIGEVVIKKEDFNNQEYFKNNGECPEDILKEMDDFPGFGKIKDIITEELDVKKEYETKELEYPGLSHMIWVGNPGTGKSTAATMITKYFHALHILGGNKPIFVDASSLFNGMKGGEQEEINRLMDRARDQNTILVIDEAYQLCPQYNQEGKDVIDAMMARMESERSQFTVIFIVYKKEYEAFIKINEGLPSRTKTIQFEDYTAEELFDIFTVMIKKNKDSLSKEVDENGKTVADNVKIILRKLKLSEQMHGNARDVRKFIDEMRICRNQCMKAAGVVADGENSWEFKTEHIPQKYRDMLINSSETMMNELEKEAAGYPVLGDVIRKILSSIKGEKMEYDIKKEKYGDKMQDYPGPSHMIWTGNPGTGKSTAARILAKYYKSLNIFFGDEPVFVDASSLIGQYVGQSQAIINEKMDEAIRKNTVLVIDEAYQLIDGMHGGNYGKSIVDAMMGRMEEKKNCFNVVFIMYREYYEEFLKINPGMRSRTITFDFADYNAEALVQIFESMCKKTHDVCSAEVLQSVREFFGTLVESGVVQKGNARLARQLLDVMRKRRFERLMAEYESMDDISCDAMEQFSVKDIPETLD